MAISRCIIKKCYDCVFECYAVYCFKTFSVFAKLICFFLDITLMYICEDFSSHQTNKLLELWFIKKTQEISQKSLLSKKMWYQSMFIFCP